MGNMDARSEVIWEDAEKRIVVVTVMDLENNISIPTTLVIEKVVERSYLKKGQEAISVRQNSRGDLTYLVDATPDEVLQRQNALISKAMRNGILRLLPGDIQSECKGRIEQIRNGDIARDPDGYKKKVLDGFATHGVKPRDLKKYLGHDVSSSSQHELAALRDLWVELNDGKATWADVMRERAEEEGAEPPPEKPEQPMEKLTERLKSDDAAPKGKPKAAKKKKEPAPPAEDDSESPFDPVAELNHLAEQMWGAKSGDALAHACSSEGIDLDSITSDLASVMIDKIGEMIRLMFPS